MTFNKSITDLIGNTPLVQIPYDKGNDNPLILAKLEYQNPGGSVKDRIAHYIIKKALRDGKLKKGDTIIDNTSGNTGIGIAMVAAALGLKTIFTSPDKVSQEKIDMLRALGSVVIITPTEAAHDDPKSCYQLAKRLARENNYFYFNQYDNADNPEAHYHSTGPEIWKQTEGKITHLVGGIGTGGTLSGTARYLKEQNREIKVIAVDPPGSLFCEYINHNRTCPTSSYLVEGIGSDMITAALDPDVIDTVITVSDKDSFETARMLTREFGILAGGSSGTAAFAAFQVAEKLTSKDLVVIIFSDSAKNYLTKCFSDEWMTKHGFSTKVPAKV